LRRYWQTPSKKENIRNCSHTKIGTNHPEDAVVNRASDLDQIPAKIAVHLPTTIEKRCALTNFERRQRALSFLMPELKEI
jgi:hypothetical protein